MLILLSQLYSIWGKHSWYVGHINYGRMLTNIIKLLVSLAFVAEYRDDAGAAMRGLCPTPVRREDPSRRRHQRRKRNGGQSVGSNYSSHSGKLIIH